ncbi:MAG: DegT/DnrJ/EryC1/StrS family aminotransferase [Acidobacteriota bacterium]
MSQSTTASAPLTMSFPDIDETDIAAVVEVLRSGRLSLGPRQEAFEEAMAEFAGVRHAVAVSSGTAALHLMVRGLGIGPGDEVLVPSFTFVASVTPILFEGATPVFVDVEDDTCNLDPVDCARHITPRTKAIMVVDAFGHPAPWTQLEALAAEHDLLLLDDCCEALGARYGDRPLGSLGAAGAFAFYANKQMTTGEGGILVTDDDDLAIACRSLRNQGRSAMGQWLAHERLGYNYRMSELAAALGCTQLARLPQFLQQRQRVADLYHQRLQGISGLRPPQARPGVTMSWFVYVIQLEEGRDRDAVIRALAEEGVPSRAYFSPIHRQPFILERFGDLSADLPRTESLARRTIALPFHNRMTEDQVDRVSEALGRALASS